MSTDPPRPRLVEPPDPFDPAALRLDQAFTETARSRSCCGGFRCAGRTRTTSVGCIPTKPIAWRRP